MKVALVVDVPAGIEQDEALGMMRSAAHQLPKRYEINDVFVVDEWIEPAHAVNVFESEPVHTDVELQALAEINVESVPLATGE